MKTCKECGAEALNHSQLCAYCLVFRDNVVRRPQFALKALSQCCQNLPRLEAIAHKIKQYDQHMIQSATYLDHVTDDPSCEDDALIEHKLAKRVLQEAIRLSREVT